MPVAIRLAPVWLLVACDPFTKEPPSMSTDTGSPAPSLTGDTGPTDTGTPPYTAPTGDTGVVDPDEDGDGFAASVDCDDADKTVFPGADELCNLVDDDCDEAVDEEPTDGLVYFVDADLDGIGSTDTRVACALVPGLSDVDTDCDDTNADVYPGAPELCDTLDNDCDTVVGDVIDVPTTWATLQEAIDATPNGGEICVGPGVYAGPIDVSNRIVTLSGGGTGDRVLDLSGNPDPYVRAVGSGSDLTMRRFDVTGLDVEVDIREEGLFLLQVGGWVTLEDMRFVDNRFVMSDRDGPEIRGGLLKVTDGGEITLTDIVIDDLEFVQVHQRSDWSCFLDGGFLYADDVTVNVDNLVATDIERSGDRVYGATTQGGLLRLTGGSELNARSITIDRANFVQSSSRWSFTNGILIGVFDSQVDIDGLTVTNSVMMSDSTGDSSVEASGFVSIGGTGTLRDLEFRDNVLEARGIGFRVEANAPLIVGGDLEITDLRSYGNSVRAYGTGDGSEGLAWGGGLNVSGSDASITLRNLDIRDNEVIGEREANGAGARLVANTGTITIENSIFAGNRAVTTEAGRFAGGAGLNFEGYQGVGPGVLNLRFVDIVGNSAEGPVVEGGGLRLYGSDTMVTDVKHVNVIGSRIAAGATPEAAGVFGPDTTSWAYSNVYDNLGGPTFGGGITPSGTGNQAADPLYVDATNPDASRWDLHLQSGSPLIDAGEPGPCDPDGSACDIGAYGGPGGDW